MHEESIIIAGLLPEPDCVLAERPVEALAALGRQIFAEIFVKDDRLADRIEQPLDLGDFLVGDSRQLVAPLEDFDLAAASALLRPHRVDDVLARLLGPVGARLGHAARGERAHGHVRPEDQKLVIALRRRELHVRILLHLHARAQRHTRSKREGEPQFPHRISPPGRVARPSPAFVCYPLPERQLKEKPVILTA
jgi:hypothetical protein